MVQSSSTSSPTSLLSLLFLFFFFAFPVRYPVLAYSILSFAFPHHQHHHFQEPRKHLMFWAQSPVLQISPQHHNSQLCNTYPQNTGSLSSYPPGKIPVPSPNPSTMSGELCGCAFSSPLIPSSRGNTSSCLPSLPNQSGVWSKLYIVIRAPLCNPGNACIFTAVR